jgi:hypothetical protein
MNEGIAQGIKDLSNPMSFTLNQRAAGSIPARPTKYINSFCISLHLALLANLFRVTNIIAGC